MSKNKKLILFGAGKLLDAYMEERCETPYLIVDNDSAKWVECDARYGIAIKSPEAIKEIPEKERQIIICSVYYREMGKQLHQMGIHKYKVFHSFFKIRHRPYFRPRHNLVPFLEKHNKGTVLDVGCGNNSPYTIKTAFPKLFYVGVDVADYNQTKPNLADEYILSPPEDFPATIAALGERFDIVISSHNLEHCNHRYETLTAMISVLKPNGFMYLSFPAEKSVKTPSRKGTLNYYDDPTHKGNPPVFKEVVTMLKARGMKIVFARKSYKPFWYWLLGFLYEPIGRKKGTTHILSWAYWGFETIIWAKKQGEPQHV